MWIDQRGSEVLGRPECLRLLAMEARTRGLGRLAVSREGAPLVQPVNFTTRAGDVLIRLGDGFLWDTVRGRLVAFEVDRVDEAGGTAWSVLVRGLARAVDPDVVEAGGEGPEPMAPVPGDHLVAVRADVVTGRRFPLRRRPPGPTVAGDRSRGRRVTV